MKQIIALGGGGFSMEPQNPLLDLYVLKAAGVPKPKICFLATASGDSADYIQRFYSAFRNYDCIPSHCSVFKDTPPDLRSFLLSQDIIYVGGGNTFNMLILWKEWGIDKILLEAFEKNIVLAGISAGAICWFDQTLTDSFPGKLTLIKGLNFIDSFCIPHFDGEANRRPETERLIEEGKLVGSGWGVEDSAALHFIDGILYKIVSSVETKTAYHYAQNASAPTRLRSQYLGAPQT